MKYLTLYIVLTFCYSLHAQQWGISSSGRHIEKNGEPFFYLGDTAWELLNRLTIDETKTYLQNRKKLGFTVVQTVILSQLSNLETPNTNGHVALNNKDPEQPNEAFFEHIDEVIRIADSMELTIGLLPTWGSYWSSLQPERRVFTPDNARKFGQFLGKRYKDDPVIWILGGDHDILNEEDRNIIEALAFGLRSQIGSDQLITFHPRGPGLSSEYFHQTDWLDFNMYQSSHGSKNHNNGLFAANDYALAPTKPTLDGEPRYENIPIGFYFEQSDSWHRFSDDDSRQAAYYSLFSGACGHTYGHNSVWQMYAPGRNPVIDAAVPWYEAIDYPGAHQMTHLYRLFTSRPWHLLKPDEDIILDHGTIGEMERVLALVSADQSYGFIYSAFGSPFTIDLRKFKGDRLDMIWFDPRLGISYKLQSNVDTKGIQTFTPPTNGSGNDWILIIEDHGKGWLMPGYR